MAIQCPQCRGSVSPKWSKLALVLGGSLAMMPLAAAFGLKAGLLALGAAAWQGNKKAGELLRIKAMLMRESEKMGSFFVCSSCGRDASIGEV